MSKGRPINNIRVLEGERPFKYYNPELPSSSLLFLDPRSDSINSSMPTSLSDFMQQRQQQINQQQQSQQQQRQDFHQQQPLALAEQQRQQVAGHVSHAHQQGFSRDYRLPQQDVSNSMLNTDPQVHPYGYDDLDMDSSSLIGESLREDLNLGSTGTGHGLTSNFMLPTRSMVRNASSSSLTGLHEPLSMLFDVTMSSFPGSLQQDSTPSMTSFPNSLQQPVSLNASLTSFRGSQQPMVPSSSGYTSYHSVHQQAVAASSDNASYPSSLQQAAAASSSPDNASYPGSIQARPSTSRMSPGAMNLAYQQHMLSLSQQYQIGVSSSSSIPTERPAGSVNMSYRYPIKKEDENKSSTVQTFQCPIKKEEDIDDSCSVLSASLSPASAHSPSSATSGSLPSKRRPTERSYSECSTASNPQDQPSNSGSDDTTRGGAKPDNAYTEKRRKNNESAKRSREARRTKEELVALRVLSLEEENMKLTTTIHMLENEMRDLSKRLMLFD